MGAFTLESEGIHLPRGAWAKTHRRRLAWNGKEIASFTQGAFRPYLYPVFTPAGFPVTTESPADHPHHHSLWIGADHLHVQMPAAEGRVEEYTYNLYLNETFQGRAPGRIVETGIGGEDTPRGYRVTQSIEWRGPAEWAAADGRVLLTEIRAWDITPGERFHLLDLRSELRAAQWALTLGPTRHAYFNFRVAEALQVVRGGKITEAGGAWLDYSGHAGGGHIAGIALMPRPSDARWWWFATDWGVVTTGPFRAEPRHMQPGESFALAARYVVHDGDAQATPLDRLYREFLAQADA
jgi:hypothetical protein